MDAVGADQNIAARGVAMAAAAIEEIGGDAAIVLRERAEPAIQMDARFTQAGARRLVDDVLQPAAMDGELRNVVAGIEAARLAPDLLAEAIGIDELVGADRDRVEPVEQAEIGKLFDRMRERIDADAKLADRVRLLENLAIDPARMQHQPGHQAADAAACDDDFHDATPDTLFFSCRAAGRGTAANAATVITAYRAGPASAASCGKCNDLPPAWL